MKEVFTTEGAHTAWPNLKTLKKPRRKSHRKQLRKRNRLRQKRKRIGRIVTITQQRTKGKFSLYNRPSDCDMRCLYCPRVECALIHPHSTCCIFAPKDRDSTFRYQPGVKVRTRTSLFHPIRRRNAGNTIIPHNLSRDTSVNVSGRRRPFSCMYSRHNRRECRDAEGESPWFPLPRFRSGDNLSGKNGAVAFFTGTSHQNKYLRPIILAFHELPAPFTRDPSAGKLMRHHIRISRVFTSWTRERNRNLDRPQPCSYCSDSRHSHKEPRFNDYCRCGQNGWRRALVATRAIVPLSL